MCNCEDCDNTRIALKVLTEDLHTAIEHRLRKRTPTNYIKRLQESLGRLKATITEW